MLSLTTKEENKCKLKQYSAAYEYLITNDSAAIHIKKAFNDVIEFEFIQKNMFCIDSIAQPLTISGFGGITDEDLRKRIRLIETEPLPFLLKMLSHCSNDPKFNLTFSIVNENYLTGEISVTFLNPFGGSSKGPSLKFLFEFNDQSDIVHVFKQFYING